ncbi:MAG: fibrobacter succinogenes major paralogous domain-containing protein [Candidatus Paceibacterota bacterium]
MDKEKSMISFAGVFILLFFYGNITTHTQGINFEHTDILIDRNVNSIGYETVKIGDQEWMVDNLNVSKFRNGELIPQAESNKEWVSAYKEGNPAWCYFDNNPINGEKYGKLYNWYAINDTIRGGIAPDGWYVPSNDEFTKLIDFLGGHQLASKKMKSNSGWHNQGDGNNESGFTGLPGGARLPNGSFTSTGLYGYGYWWSSSEYLTANAWSRILYYNNAVITTNHHKASGFSVRLLKE